MDNTALFFQIFNLQGKSAVLDQLMIFASTSLIYLTFLFTLFIALKGGIKERKSLILMIIAIPLSVLLIKIIHIFFYEIRPWVTFNLTPLTNHSPDASFPSRHATLSAAVAFVYTYYKSRWAPLFLFIMAWIGFSRIFVGVHYPLDILGGFITGIVALLLSISLKKLVFARILKFP